jgi:hypothetical protein
MSMVTVYHVTPMRNLKAIQVDGLQPRYGRRSKSSKDPKINSVFFFKNLEDCDNALVNWLGRCFSDEARLALLAVNIEPHLITNVGCAGFECRTEVSVSPAAIRILSHDVQGETSVVNLDNSSSVIQMM